MRTGAKSVFHFDVQGSVAKSTHAGLPWLRYLRKKLGDRVHFWPFDGWDAPVYRSVIAEVYPRPWKGLFPVPGQTADHDGRADCQRTRLSSALSAARRPRDCFGLLPTGRALAMTRFQ